MRRLLPLVILALAGCDQFREEVFPKERRVYEADGKAYAVATTFDPLEFAYFSQVSNADAAGLPLSGDDKSTVQELVLARLGPEYCDGRKMALTEFNSENLPGGGNMVLLKSRGTYQVVTRCTLDTPDFFPDRPDWPTLPTESDLPALEDVLPSL